MIIVVVAAAAALLATGCKPDYPKCENDEHCQQKGEYCVNGLCQQCRDNSQCGTCQQCAAGKCSQVFGCCTDDSNCGAGQKCRNGQCGPECMTNEECGGGKVACQAGRCVPVACLAEGDCPAGQACVNNDCVDTTPQCGLDTVYFDFDESVLTSSGRGSLDGNADCMKKKGVTKLLKLQPPDSPRGAVVMNLIQASGIAFEDLMASVTSSGSSDLAQAMVEFQEQLVDWLERELRKHHPSTRVRASGQGSSRMQLVVEGADEPRAIRTLEQICQQTYGRDWQRSLGVQIREPEQSTGARR